MRNPIRLILTVAISACAIGIAQDACAQVDLGLLQVRAPQTTFAQFTIRGLNKVPVLVHVPTSDASLADAEGLLRLSTELYSTREQPDALTNLVAKYQNWRWLWTPPRRLFLDKVVKNVHADTAQKDFGRTGKGVVVGIVDTGIDPTHPDLRFADGRTRVKYYLDLTQPKPLGLNADDSKLEGGPNGYGCTTKDASGAYLAPCAVYSADDINAMLTSQALKNLPQDAIGHGTHVASLAAGNGLSNSPPKYVGIAPEADLVVVNASRQNLGDLADGDIILGAKFVFDIADNYLNEPAIVNLSLGGDAGAHDGSSDLEVALSSYVGPDHPGHAIVVAAGNSGGVDNTMFPNYPQPLGTYTSVQVLPDGNQTRVPILVDSSQDPSSDSIVLAWVQGRAGDQLSIGVETDSGTCIAPIDRNQAVDSKDCGGIKVSLINGHNVDSSIDSVGGGSDERPPLVMVAEGSFASPQVLALTLSGSGTAFIWVEGSGGLVGGQCENGVCVPAAAHERTVAIPASAPDLIAVGATYNRTAWTDVDGTDITLQTLGATSALPPSVGEVAGFSAGGPNQLDDIKPDILAPGGFVAGAMAKLADPRVVTNKPGGMFDASQLCNDCTPTTLVVDDWHGIALGTSMAAPVVAGAIALMFEVDRNLSQDDARLYLQSGAQDPSSVSSMAQEGPGLLDIDGALKAQSGKAVASGVANGATSWYTLATALIHPDDTWPTRGTLHLRDAKNQAVTIDPSRVQIDVSPGHLLGPVQAQGYGYYTFEFVAGQGTGRQNLTLEIRVDHRQLVLENDLLIGVDVPSYRGEVVAGRGCSIAKVHVLSPADFWGWGFTLGMIGVAQRRRRNRAAYRFEPPATPVL